MTDVSQAVNEFLVKENARLSAEVKELRDTVMFARDQWKTMAQVVEKLDRMDRRLEIALNHLDAYDDSRDRERLRRIKADRGYADRGFATGTNSSPF